jgi:RNA polymerase sigma factor (sigma-70 family)
MRNDRQTEMNFTEEAIAGFTARQRAILKLRFGVLTLADDEMEWVLPSQRAEAVAVKSRSLQEVAELFGISRERVRQIESRLCQRLES